MSKPFRSDRFNFRPTTMAGAMMRAGLRTTNASIPVMVREPTVALSPRA